MTFDRDLESPRLEIKTSFDRPEEVQARSRALASFDIQSWLRLFEGELDV